METTTTTTEPPTLDEVIAWAAEVAAEVDAVDTHDIATRLGVKPETVHQWSWKGRMPAPTWTFSGRPVWMWAVIETWAADTGRLPA